MDNQAYHDWVYAKRAGIEFVSVLADSDLSERAIFLALRHAKNGASQLKSQGQARALSVKKIEAGWALVTSHPGASTTEYGVLRRGRPYMAVPFGDEVRIKHYAGPRLKFIRAKNGRAYLVSGGVIRYEMRQHVRIEPHPYIRPALRHAEEWALREIERRVRSALTRR